MRPFLAVALASCTFAPAPAEVEPGSTPDPTLERPGVLAPDRQTRPEPVKVRIVDTSGLGLNLRAHPGTDAAVLAVMPEHVVVPIVSGPAGVTGAWWEIEYRGQRGFAYEAYLEWLQPGVAPADDRGWNFLLPWAEGARYPVTQGHNTGSHTGVDAWAWDFGLPLGTPVVAAHGGVVRTARGSSTMGGCSSDYLADANYVVIDRGDGLESEYLHLDGVAVAVGDQVARGQVIGTSGQTGWACSPHLHFQVQIGPAGGGADSYYNASVRQFFWDTGDPIDPPFSSEVLSHNDTDAIP